MNLAARVSAVCFVAGARSALAASGPLGISPDSYRYRDELFLLDVFRFDLGQGPGQLVQFINFLPVPAALALQTLIAVLAWGWAAEVATRGLRWYWFWLVFLFSVSPWWLVWDWRVLTEALTIAGMALFAAGVARWLDQESSTPMIVGACIALLARPLVVPLVIGVLGVAFVARRRLPTRKALVVLVALVAFAGIQSVVWNTAVARFFWLPRPMTLSAIQAADRMGARSQLSGYQELAKEFGMPNCPEVARLEYGFGGSWIIQKSQCPGMAEWIDAGGLPWWAEVVYNPLPIAKEVVSGPWLGSTWADYDNGTVNAVVDKNAVDWPMWAAWALASVGLLAPGSRWVARALVVLGANGYALVLLLVDGMENWRHMLPALVVLVPFAVGSLSRHQAKHLPKRARIESKADWTSLPK